LLILRVSFFDFQPASVDVVKREDFSVDDSLDTKMHPCYLNGNCYCPYDSIFRTYDTPHEKIERLAARHGWTIHRLDRTITASKVSRRRQEEWITTNY